MMVQRGWLLLSLACSASLPALASGSGDFQSEFGATFARGPSVRHGHLAAAPAFVTVKMWGALSGSVANARGGPSVSTRPELAVCAGPSFISSPVPSAASLRAWSVFAPAPSHGSAARTVGRAGPLTLTMRGPPAKTEKSATTGVGHKVLVLNASFEPLSVVTASRALCLMWDEKAIMIIPHDKTWTSCSGEVVELPSVVCLRRYIKVHPKFPVVNRRTVLMRDRGCCQYCGRLAENVDHVIPRSKGGLNIWTNVVASCAPCNNRKADKLIKDTDMSLKRQPTTPSAVSWVHSAVWKVDPRWKPYVGETCWSDIENMWKGTKLDVKRVTKSKKKSTAQVKAEQKAYRKAAKEQKKAGKEAAGGMTQAEVDDIVAAYTPLAEDEMSVIGGEVYEIEVEEEETDNKDE